MQLLVAADGSGVVRDSVLPAIVALADGVSPEVTVLHVVHAASEAWSDEELTQVMADRRENIEQLVRDASFPVEVLIEALPYGGTIDYYIAHRANDLDVDAIVVCSKRSTGIVGGLLGSIAQGLLEHSPVPVIVVRPDGDDDDEPDAKS